MSDDLREQIDKLKNEVAVGKEFVNLAAHQLQEPLASMRWQLDNILGGRAGTLNPKQRLVIDGVYAINQDAIRLVKDLLIVARLEGGHLKVQRAAVDVVALVNRVKKRYESAVKEYRGVMHFNSPHEKIPQLEIDARLLTQAIDNLVSNALKYSPAGAHIDIGVKRDGASVIISVRNSGPAIPEEKQKLLFQKFMRAETKGTRKTGGTGLGLYITRQIVALHGGEISVESTDEKGTTFSIRLPLDSE